MLTSTRVARREKGRRGNPINRYSSTVKCGNDCVLGRIFFTTPWNARHARRPATKADVIDIADFQKPGMPKERNERRTACRSIWDLSISRSRKLMQIQDAHHQYAWKPLNYSTMDSIYNNFRRGFWENGGINMHGTKPLIVRRSQENRKNDKKYSVKEKNLRVIWMHF